MQRYFVGSRHVLYPESYSQCHGQALYFGHNSQQTMAPGEQPSWNIELIIMTKHIKLYIYIRDLHLVSEVVHKYGAIRSLKCEINTGKVYISLQLLQRVILAHCNNLLNSAAIFYPDKY